MTRPVPMFFRCEIDEAAGLAEWCEEQAVEWEREQDEARELELDPYQEVAVAHEDAFYCEMYYPCRTS